MRRKLNDYLVTFSFHVGEYAVPFRHILRAADHDDLRARVKVWMRRFYGREGRPECSETRCLYFGGEVFVTYEGSEEIRDAKQITGALRA